MMPYDCFISYASADLTIAEELHQRLIMEGFSVWFDKSRLDPGCDWHKEIEQGCENSRVFLPVLTPRWKLSEWTRYETYGAESVIPILFEGDWADVTPPPLEKFQAERMSVSSLEEANWVRLFSALRRLLDKPMPQKQNRLVHLHYLVNDYFVGRDGDLIRIHEELHSNPRAVLSQGRVRAIAAMGGVGKTTLVRQYAERFWRCYPQIFWVDARRGFETEFSELHDLLFPERTDIGLRVEDKAKQALHELHGPVERLLIIDNAEDEESVTIWIPKTGSCHTLITSRFAGFSAAVKTLHLFVLEREPAIEFLQRRTQRSVVGSELASCAELAEKLGYLPLALEQAAAYIWKQRLGFGDYLRIYEKAKRDLLAIRALGSTDYPDSVITSLQPSVRKLTPGARAILRLASFLANTPISLRMLSASPDLVLMQAQFFAGGATGIQPLDFEFWIRNEIGSLVDFSLVSFDGQFFSLHPLLQTIEYETQPEGERSHTWSIAAQLVANAAPIALWKDDFRQHWTLESDRAWGDLFPHVERLLGLRDKTGETPFTPCFDILAVNAHASQKPDLLAIEICQRACKHLSLHVDENDPLCIEAKECLAYLLRMNFQNVEALDMFQKLHQLRAKLLGEDHPDTLRALHNVVLVMRQMGGSSDLEPLYRDILERRRRALGDDHYDTIESIHDLGLLLSDDEARHDEAESLLRQAVDWDKRNLDPSSPDTRAASSNLARLLKNKGDFTQAEQIQRDLIEMTKEVLGEGHLECFGLMHNLSLFIFNTGSYDEALSTISSVVEGYRRYLPPTHRDMLTALQDLGTLLGQMGDLDQAETLLREALSGYLLTQTAGSKDRIRTTCNLAGLLQKKGDEAGAEQFWHQALEESIQAHSLENRETLDILSNLGILQYNKGDKTGARTSFRQVSEGRKALFGSDHRDTLASIFNLASVEEDLGNLEEAEKLFRELMSIQGKLHPLNHDESLRSLDNLALFLERNKRVEEAEQLYERGVETRKEVLGAEHAGTLTCMNCLANMLGRNKEYARAESLYRYVLEVRERTLGAEHCDTLVSMNNMGWVLKEQRDFPAAEVLLRRALALRERVSGPEDVQTMTVVENLADLLKKTDRTDEGRTLLLRRVDILAARSDTAPITIRGLALDCFMQGEYARAEDLLKRLLRVGFQPPGTRHHLARLCLMTDRYPEAREHVSQAWACRDKSPPYLVGRLLWFQLALGMIKDEEQKSVTMDQNHILKTLGMLKTALQSEATRMQWTMDPVLNHLEPRLSALDHKILSALIAALSDWEKLAELDQFPVWCDAVPQSLD